MSVIFNFKQYFSQDEFVNRVFPTTRFYELNVKLLDEQETIPDDADGDAKVLKLKRFDHWFGFPISNFALEFAQLQK